MVTTIKPNTGHGITYCPTLDAPKALVMPETVINNGAHLRNVWGYDFFCKKCLDVDATVKWINRFRPERNPSALLVMVDDTGEYAVYDSLTQRGGKGQKKEVRAHRFKLFTALMLAAPGLCQDFLSFMASHVDINEEPHPTTTPIESITTKAAHKLLPERIKELYKQIQTLEHF